VANCFLHGRSTRSAQAVLCRPIKTFRHIQNQLTMSSSSGSSALSSAQKKAEGAKAAADKAVRDGISGQLQKQGVDPRALKLAQAAQKGELTKEDMEAAASSKLKELNPEMAGMVLGDDGKFDQSKAMARLVSFLNIRHLYFP
jgi:hypothetical protein